MQYLTIRPLLGTKNNCPIDSPEMYKLLGKDARGRWNDVITHDAGGQNFDLGREKDSCCKAFGRACWSNSANAQATKCLGLHELWDGTNREHFYFDNGKVYRYETVSEVTRSPVDVSGEVTFAKADADLYSIIQYGTYMVFSDHGTTEPYKIDYNDAAVSVLQADNNYTFRYLVAFNNRIVGFYSNQSNGDIEIRWTEALAETTFPAANQLYKAGDSISGAAQLGRNFIYVYGENDIYRLEYSLVVAMNIFKLTPVLENWGSINHHAIASDGIYLYTYDRNRGFYKFNGIQEPTVISDSIEKTIARIPTNYDNLIFGKAVPDSPLIVWAIPVDNDTTPSKLVFYNTKTNQWTMQHKAARCLDFWRTFSDVTWNDLIVLTDDVYPSARTWTYYTSEQDFLVWGNSDGHLYTNTSEGDDASDWECYRIEPILPFPDNQRYKRLQEIWVSIAETQSHSLDFYWRGGDTVAEVEGKAWTNLGSISMNNPDDAVLYPDQSARLHQLKWGTDLKTEPFSVPEIKLGYVMEGLY